MELLSMDDENYWGNQPGGQWGRNLRDASAYSGLRTSNYALGDSEDPGVPVAAIVEYPPNYELPRHSHASARFEVVLSGSISINGRVLGPGSVMRADANELYGPHIIGPEGCVTVEVMNGLGARLLTFETSDGPRAINLDAPDALSKLESAVARP